VLGCSKTVVGFIVALVEQNSSYSNEKIVKEQPQRQLHQKITMIYSFFSQTPTEIESPVADNTNGVSPHKRKAH
jgi:hypothetical protein